MAANLCLTGAAHIGLAPRHPARQRPNQRQVSWLAGLRPSPPSRDAPSGIVVRARRLQLRGQLRPGNLRSAPHSLFALDVRDRWSRGLKARRVRLSTWRGAGQGGCRHLAALSAGSGSVLEPQRGRGLGISLKNEPKHTREIPSGEVGDRNKVQQYQILTLSNFPTHVHFSPTLRRSGIGACSIPRRGLTTFISGRCRGVATKSRADGKSVGASR